MEKEMWEGEGTGEEPGGAAGFGEGKWGPGSGVFSKLN